ncbi:hypothetical protein [Clavibacter zhangzhiyongii]|uniref:Uncharacterized protein n=1 Tax=Clavibacter zhangzhiyongii TaxID=2768071 RepID=A0A7L7Z1L7_9MICO|nr:hypothetical protein [Clavibacter zhangzhiyongii]QOD43549.1 hypothetical protein H9X71_13325 [Clavibacter zhangzhiyongii]
MSTETILHFSRALASHIQAGEALIIKLLEEGDRREESAAKLHLDSSGDISRDDIRHAHQDLLMTALSGLDHFKAFCSTLEARPVGAWALGSLARGATEAFGKVAYFLESETTEEFYYRFSRLRIKSVSYLAGEEYREYETEWGRRARDHAARWEAELISNSGEPVSKTNTPTPPRLAKNLLRKTFEARASSWYASVAALSHSEYSAMDRLVDPTIHNNHDLIVVINGLYVDVEQLVAPPMLVESYVLRSISEYFGLSEVELNDWIQTGTTTAEYAAKYWTGRAT